MSRRHPVPEQPQGLNRDQEDMLGYLWRYQVCENQAEHCSVEQHDPVFSA